MKNPHLMLLEYLYNYQAFVEFTDAQLEAMAFVALHADL